jgi:hypothetical protein
LSPAGLSHLHARYAVSWSALLVRLSEVLRVSVAVFRHHARHSSEPERWRVHRLYGAAHGVWLPVGMTTRHFSATVVEEAAAQSYAAASLVIDVPSPTPVRAVASSLVRARENPHQVGLFDQLPPEEPARWSEVAVFLAPQEEARPSDRPVVALYGTPMPHEARPAAEQPRNLSLW